MNKGTQNISKFYLLPILIACVIVLVLYKFTLPQINQILQVRQELKAERTHLEQLITKAKTLEKLDTETLRQNFQILQKALPSEKDAPGILITLSRLENESTLTDRGFNFKPGLISTPSASTSASPTATGSAGAPVKGKAPLVQTKTSTQQPLASLDFGLSLEGGLSSVRNMLGKLREISPILGLSSMSMQQKAGTSISQSSSSASLKMSAYYQLLPSVYIKIDDSLPVLTEKDEEILTEVSSLPIYSELPLGVNLELVGKINPFE